MTNETYLKDYKQLLKKDRYEKFGSYNFKTIKEIGETPVMVITKTGNAYVEGKKINYNAYKDIVHYEFYLNQEAKNFFFIEEAEINGKKAIKLYATCCYIQKARETTNIKEKLEEICSYQCYITPDFKIYNKNKQEITCKDLFSNWVIRSFKNNGLDARWVKTDTSNYRINGVFAPETLELMSNIGFDITPIPSFWATTYDPRSSVYNSVVYQGFTTSLFAECLKHPNKRKLYNKRKSQLTYSWDSLKNNSENFWIENDKDSVSLYIKDTYHVAKINYKKKTGDCQLFTANEKGVARKSNPNLVSDLYSFFDYGAISSTTSKETQEQNTNVLKAFIKKNIEIFKPIRGLGFILPRYLNYLNTVQSILLFMTPKYFKDMLLEQTLKTIPLDENFEKSVFNLPRGYIYTGSLRNYIYTNDRLCSKIFALDADLTKTKPWQQVYLSKKTYEDIIHEETKGLFNDFDPNFSLARPLWALIEANTGSEGNVDYWWYRSNYFVGKEYKTCIQKYGKFLSSEDIVYMLSERCSASANTLRSFLPKYFGKEISEIFVNAGRILKNLHKINVDWLDDYYRNINNLRNAYGLNWPKAKTDFNKSTIIYFINKVLVHVDLAKRYCRSINLEIEYHSAVERFFGSATEEDFINRAIRLLHDISSYLGNYRNIEAEKASLKDAEERYLPWKNILEKKFNYSNQEYIIKVPDTLFNIKEEGRNLSHCVGSYCLSVAARETAILFLRKKEDPNSSFYTIEINQDGNLANPFKIRQVHGARNSQPTEEVIKFLHEWAQATKNIDEKSISESYGALCCAH